MQPLLPKLRAGGSAKLFVFGATIGPVVDSFHNQCLLRYDWAPITVPWPAGPLGSSLARLLEQEYLLCSSWSVPLLLGFAYVVLGDLLPRLFQWMLLQIPNQPSQQPQQQQPTTRQSGNLRTKAILAVVTTALIIKLSQFLELHDPFLSADTNYAVLLTATLIQWWALDGSLAALLAAGITSIGGPLSELPFVANGLWHYIPEAGDYLPLTNLPENLGNFLKPWLGDSYSKLALSSITGPCYFAVTLDAIALGRWFQSSSRRDDDNQEKREIQ
ncbi:expressed unknown protein [Seminavis robusta]|uniref:Uncharacterized protein n=1 Tax=Seminavis robusta TaxID=568900 RepID=A0A9N8HFC3_9STRA|nr:expressed unknown protein [Seminavis robusta]|eukprot:Sro343_g121930.1 n/a (273) ;mRNA; f:17681-18499